MPLGPPADPNRFETFDECVDALSEEMPEEDARAVCGAWEQEQTMTRKQTTTLDKRVEFKALDEERQIATGGVLVPDSVDLQGDFVREDTIRDFAEDFMQRLQSTDGEAVPGVMHAVFPTNHMTLVENDVLDDERTIGEESFPAGTWIQSWEVEDSELWSLIEEGVISGYSIGASRVEWSDAMDQADLSDDVTLSEEYPNDEPVWQILDGEINEVSAVDLPAVPQATIASLKSEGAKSILDHVEGKHEFVGVMQDRGHGEDAAERLWHYLQRALEETDGKTAPTPSDSTLTRWGRSMWDTITGESNSKTATTAGGAAHKEGRTLSQANRDAMFASIDAQLGVLDDANVDHGMTRFSDRDDVAFDLTDYGKAAPSEGTTSDENEDGEVGAVSQAADTAAKQDRTPQVGDAVRWDSDAGGSREPDDERYGIVVDGLQDEDADVVLVAVYQPNENGDGWEPRNEQNTMDVETLEVVGDNGVGSLPPVDQVTSTASTSDADNTTDMTNADDPLADAPDWAKALHDDVQENSTQIDDLAEKLSDPDDSDDPEKVWEDAPEWAKALHEKQETNRERVDALAEASGKSQQLSGDNETETASKADILGLPGGEA